MVSYSIVFRRDPRSFVQEGARCRFDGLIVPDLTLEEGDELRALGRACDCPLVMIVAPNSPPERRRQIAARVGPVHLLPGARGSDRRTPRAAVGPCRAYPGAESSNRSADLRRVWHLDRRACSGRLRGRRRRDRRKRDRAADERSRGARDVACGAGFRCDEVRARAVHGAGQQNLSPSGSAGHRRAQPRSAGNAPRCRSALTMQL